VTGFMVFLQLESTKNNSFIESYNRLGADTKSLTAKYQDEVGKWQSKQYDNKTMISLTESYLPKFQELIDKAKQIVTPEKYKNALDLTIKSIELEKQSYEHFKNYLSTNNPAENQKSIQSLSDSLRYETDGFAAYRAVK
jgi:hypothetical protein